MTRFLPFFAADDLSFPMPVVGVVVILIALITLAVLARYFGLWIQCKMTGADISLAQLVLMSLRKVNPSVIVCSKIMAVQAGITSIYRFPPMHCRLPPPRIPVSKYVPLMRH